MTDANACAEFDMYFRLRSLLPKTSQTAQCAILDRFIRVEANVIRSDCCMKFSENGL